MALALFTEFSVFWSSVFLLPIGIFKSWSHLIAEMLSIIKKKKVTAVESGCAHFVTSTLLWGRAVAIPMTLLQSVSTPCHNAPPPSHPLRKRTRKDFQHPWIWFVGLHENRRVFRVKGPVAWLSDVYTFYFHPAVQVENKSWRTVKGYVKKNRNWDLDGNISACCFCLIFKDKLQRSSEKFHGLGQQFFKANGTGQCHGIPVLFPFHWVRTAIPKLEPVVKYFTKYVNRCKLCSIPIFI